MEFVFIGNVVILTVIWVNFMFTNRDLKQENEALRSINKSPYVTTGKEAMLLQMNKNAVKSLEQAENQIGRLNDIIKTQSELMIINERLHKHNK